MIDKVVNGVDKENIRALARAVCSPLRCRPRNRDPGVSEVLVIAGPA